MTRDRLPRNAVGQTPARALHGRRPTSPPAYCAFPTLVLGATSAISPIFISLTPFDIRLCVKRATDRHHFGDSLWCGRSE